MRFSLRRAGLAVLLALPAVFIPAAVLADGVPTSAASLSASAGTYYITQINQGAIARVDVGSNGTVKVTEHYIAGLPTAGPDSAVFASDGTMLVSNFGAGSISRVDVNARKIITAQVNKTLVDTIADLAVNPAGNDVWGIVYGGAGPTAIVRVDLGTGVTTPMNVDSVTSTGGITFNLDGSRLFVSSHDGYIAEIDPHTGHVVRKATVPGSPDGMTFDPSTGYAFASGCGGICELDTGGGKLRLVKVFQAVDGDGIAADGNGHVYIAEGSCGALCRLDLSTGQGVAISDEISGADDVTPLTGAGSAAGTSCKTLGTCFNGAAAAGIAAASVGLVVFLGAAGFNSGGQSPVPLNVATHGASNVHGASMQALAHASAATPGAAHAGAATTPAQPVHPHPHAQPPPAPPGQESPRPEEASHLQEEAGDKLMEAGGAGLEHGVEAATAPAVEEEELEGEGGMLGGTRLAAEEDDDAPPPPPPPPPDHPA